MKFGDKYKFAICTNGTDYRYVTLSKSVTVSGKREKETARFSRKSSEWKFLRYENYDAYTELVAQIAAPSTLEEEIMCRIELYDSYTTLTEYLFEGYVLLNGISINEDEGVITFTPEEKSLYAWYDEHKTDKLEIINIVTGNLPLKYDVTTVTEKYYLPHGYGFATPTGFGSSTALIKAYDKDTYYVGGYTGNSWSRLSGVLWHCVYDNGPGDLHEPGTDDYWERLELDDGHYVNIVDKVYRQLSDLPLTDNSGNVYQQGNGLFEIGFPAVLLADSDSSLSNSYQNRFTYPSPSSVTETETFDPGTYTLMGGCFKLYDPSGPNTTATNSVMDHLLKGSGLIVHSHFFEDANNPVTGSTNKLNNLRLAHGKFIKGTMDYSTSCEIGLEEILKDLCNTFNLMWYISGTNLIIEHVTYFTNGFSYSSATTIYSDLTNITTYPYKWQTIFDIDGSGSDKDYKFVVESVQKEIFHFNDGYDYDGEIWYDSKFAKKGEKTERNITSFITDFSYLLYNRAESIDDTLCLIACESDGTIYRRATGLRWLKNATTDLGRGFTRTESTAVTGFDFPNGDLMWHNLLNDFWKHNVLFLNGRINNQTSPTTFTTQKRIKQQREIKFPRLESGAFDPYGLITTNIGNGEVSEYEIDTDTDFIKVTLLY